MFDTEPAYKQLVDVLISNGMTAQFVTDANYTFAIMSMNTNTVLIYNHDLGEDVILMGDNEIDVVRFNFREGRRKIRG